MARKRRRRKRCLKKQLKVELIGLLFIFLAIFGSGASAISSGIIPNGLENIFRFFLGMWYFLASVALLIIGLYLLIKRRYPDFFHKKMIGIYLGVIGLLLLTHIQTYEPLIQAEENASILRLTWQNLFDAFGVSEIDPPPIGGGLIGGLLFTFTYHLFSSIGAKIVAVFSIVIGFIFMTDFSIGQFVSNLFEKLLAFFKNKKEQFKKDHQKQETTEEASAETDLSVPTTYLASDSMIDQEAQTTDDAYDVEKVDVVTNFEQGMHPSELNSEEDDEPLNMSAMDGSDESDDYELPSLQLLSEPVQTSQQQEKGKVQTTVRTLERTFQSFGVKAKVTKVHVGPAVTKYEVYPEAGVKVSRIVSLHDDLALALAAQDLRIEAPIPGKSAVGIEVPNNEIAMVSLREVLETKMNHPSKLMFALGRDISGDAIVGELNKLPHLLIAGATGSGKSVCINAIITSILMRAKPNEVKLMMIDPKKVELNVYNGIPHLLAPVVTDPKKASQALKKVVVEMERRYELFSETGTRNIEGYNEYLKNQQTDAQDEDKQPYLPYIVVLIDELADLMMVASKDVEDAITRLAQMARAAGIHLIIATQRPSVDVITGVIKANIPSRIAFSVSSQVDSRTILDMSGAEKLLGRGDMLYIPVGRSKPIRVQGAFLSDEEVERVVNHCINEQQVTYQEEMIPDEPTDGLADVDDELYEDAVQLVIDMQTASVSMLQRRFRIGYNRAARLIDAMEERGIVGPHEGSKPREVLIEAQQEGNNASVHSS